MRFVLIFLGGALLCNCIPHLAAGLRGEPFPTPFAMPRGVGQSSPLLNFIWGAINLAIGVWIAVQKMDSDESIDLVVLGAGFFLIGLFLSFHFGRVRASRLP
jgi:FtsH-binding integral membrane protein